MILNFETEKSLKKTRIIGPAENEVLSLKYNSKEVQNNSAFFCIHGQNSNGHAFIEEALKNGASVIVGSDDKELEKWSHKYKKVTFITVEETKSAMASMSSLFYEGVHNKMKSIAVTGTNGKTTVTAFVHSMLNEIGIPAGSIGTQGVYNDKEKIAVPPTTPTTPESPDLHGFLNTLHGQGVEAYVMEATSIAIEQKRIDGMEFDVGVHTNLTPEHLEFHGSYAAYKEAKLKLFNQVKKTVINLDDSGLKRELLSMSKGPVLTYSLENKEADVWASNVSPGNEGYSFDLHIKDRMTHVEAPLYGKYNISNLMAAICVCLHFEIPVDKILAAIPSIKGPEGRFQVLSHHADYRIVLDYAHTPDALKKVLEAVKTIKYNRLIVMITGIGLRNPQKRPLMAKAVEGEADEIVVSVDHPGFFDRKTIVEDVLAGLTNPTTGSIHTELHREKGIHRALSLAQKGDLVLLTGIGFGGYQVIEGRKEYYSELEVIDDYYQTVNN